MTKNHFLRGLPPVLLFVVLVMLPTVLFAQAGPRRNPGRLWSSDYRGALATAQQESKPVMVVFRCVP